MSNDMVICRCCQLAMPKAAPSCPFCEYLGWGPVFGAAFIGAVAVVATVCWLEATFSIIVGWAASAIFLFGVLGMSIANVHALRIGKRLNTGALHDALKSRVIGRLKAPEKEVVLAAIEALANAADPAAVAPLGELLQSYNPDMACAAARALGKIGHTSCVPPLMAILEAGKNGQRLTREAALAALATFDDPQVKQAVTRYEALETTRDLLARESSRQKAEEQRRRTAESARPVSTSPSNETAQPRMDLVAQLQALSLKKHMGEDVEADVSKVINKCKSPEERRQLMDLCRALGLN